MPPTEIPRAKFFALDLRALALWRISMGAIVLLDIILRLRDLQAFYGDQGVLSRSLFLGQTWQPPVYHLFLSAGTTGGLLTLFGLWALAAFCLMIGYHARIAGFITWYFVASIQLRNPLVLDGGDDLMRLLLFWTPFLPIEARWSWRARYYPEWANLPHLYRSVASLGLTLQFFLLYFFAALLKSGDDWWKTGDALYYALSLDQFATGLGRSLSQFPEFLRAGTGVALGMEYAIAVLLLLGGRWTWARTAFFCLAVSFHIIIASLLHFGIFMLIALAGLVLFIPSAWLDRWGGAPGKGQLCEPLPIGYRLGRPGQLFAAFMALMLIVFNVYSIRHVQRIPPWATPIMEWTYEQQHWHLFAPNPIKEDGWYVLEVTAKDGTIHDAWGDEPLGEKPISVASRFANQRWRRWMQNLTQVDAPDKEGWRRSTLDWFVREWSATHALDEVQKFRLVFMRESAAPPGSQPVVAPEVLAEQDTREPRPPAKARSAERDES